MATEVRVSVEGKRGCGYRQEKGIYIVSAGISRPCGRLPIPCDICPCCGGGIKPSRSWTWVDADALFLQYPCKIMGQPHCLTCPARESLGRAGLLWIGGKYYPTPAHWTHESEKVGVSRRLPHVPKDLEIGKTWVLVAHREVINAKCSCITTDGEGFFKVQKTDPDCKKCQGIGHVKLPGIFHMFKPTAVEYIVTGKETEEELEQLVKRGLTPVRVVRDMNGQPELDLSKVKLGD